VTTDAGDEPPAIHAPAPERGARGVEPSSFSFRFGLGGGGGNEGIGGAMLVSSEIWLLPRWGVGLDGVTGGSTVLFDGPSESMVAGRLRVAHRLPLEHNLLLFALSGGVGQRKRSDHVQTPQCDGDICEEEPGRVPREQRWIAPSFGAEVGIFQSSGELEGGLVLRFDMTGEARVGVLAFTLGAGL
jgi:hypothetical protein